MVTKLDNYITHFMAFSYFFKNKMIFLFWGEVREMSQNFACIHIVFFSETAPFHPEYLLVPGVHGDLPGSRNALLCSAQCIYIGILYICNDFSVYGNKNIFIVIHCHWQYKLNAQLKKINNGLAYSRAYMCVIRGYWIYTGKYDIHKDISMSSWKTAVSPVR